MKTVPDYLAHFFCLKREGKKKLCVSFGWKHHYLEIYWPPVNIVRVTKV